MARVFLQCLGGSDNSTRASFPFRLAVDCKERGDEVEIGLGGDAVALIRDEVIDGVAPMGWPPLKETFQKVVRLGIPIRV